MKKQIPGIGLLKNNKLVSNFFYLSLVQFVSLAIPLILTPYLIEKLGLELFGMVTFSQAIMLLLAMVVEFGFNISATRNISVNRNSPSELNSIFSNVMAAKAVLLLAAFILFLVLLLFSQFNNHTLFYFASFLIVVGQAFLPTWVFQGLENMRTFSFITITGRVLYLFMVLAFVKQPEDVILVNLFWGGSFLVSTMCCLAHLNYSHKIHFVTPSIENITKELYGGLHLFLTTVSINVYTYANSAILGFFVGYQAVGLYGIAERVMMLLKQALIVFSQVFYPAGCRAAVESVSSYKRLLKKAYLPFLAFFAFMCIVAFFNTAFIVDYFYKAENYELEQIIKLFVVAVFITSLNVPAYQTLLSFNHQKSYSFALSFSCVVSLILNFFLTSKFGLHGTSLNVVLTEVIVTVVLFATLHLWHKPISFFNRRVYV